MLKEYFKVNELSLLFVSEGKEELKEHLIDELDYILLPKEGWEKIVESYGITEGQVQILLFSNKYCSYIKIISSLKTCIFIINLKILSKKHLGKWKFCEEWHWLLFYHTIA